MDIEEVRKTWEAFGSTDPMWAVLTDPERLGNRWDPVEFFATGDRDVTAILDKARAAGLNVNFDRALDFGCGVGRLTQALAKRFKEVHGVDIAESMIDRARKFDGEAGKCVFHLNTADNLRLFPDGYFDFACSLITLQHIEPRYSAGYLQELLRVLAPGGVLVFQLPAKMTLDHRIRQLVRRALPSRVVYAYRRLRHGQEHASAPDRFVAMEMYGTSRGTVKRLLERAGGRLARAVRDRHADNWVSYSYFVAKP